MKSALRHWTIAGVAVALLAGACSGGGEQDVDEDGSAGASVPVVPVVARSAVPDVVGSAVLDEPGSGLHTNVTVRLSEGSEGEGSGRVGESSPTVSRVEGEVLSEEEIRSVTDRLPPWEGDDTGEADFNRPPDSLPPPRTGRTVDQPFPAGPDIAAPVVDPGPLEVLRVQPEGEVGLAPFFSITFNQPMVSLATVAQLDDADVPVEMTPPLPGRWQWIGTRTLRFEHDQGIFDRLPMATSYTVEVPVGTRSQSGGELARTFRAEFETPPPSLVRLEPQHHSLDLLPVFVALFDQRVEPSEVLNAVTLVADGEEREIRLVTAAEIEADEFVRSEADEFVRYYVEQALEGTWVAFGPVSPLEPNSEIRITVGPNVPSAEGPNTSGESSTTEARTYGPLRIVDSSCARRPCWPGEPLEAWFNNPLDAATLVADEFSITPEIPGATISIFSNSLYISGPTVRGTVYKVVIPATVGDVFGQTLGEPETVEFEIEEASPLIWSPGGHFVTLDPFAEKQTIPVIVRHWERLRVRLYAVDPSDYGSYERFEDFGRQFLYERDPTVVAAPWPLTAEETIDTGISDSALTEVRLDLSSVLKGEHGHVVVTVEGARRTAGTSGGDPSRSRAVAWVQDTDIGIDFVTDGRDLAAWTTDLRSGDPLPGVEIQLGPSNPGLISAANGIALATLTSVDVRTAVASLGDDRALVPVYFQKSPPEDQVIWYTADDRGMYRPGETLSLKGWVRNLDWSGDGDLEFLPSGTLIAYTAHGPLGNELGSGDLRTDDHGGFDLALELREGANLGWS